MKNIASIVLLIGLLAAAALTAMPAAAQDWNSNPANWKNNPGNWQNSPSNWRNNPGNWENSPSRYGNDRIIRDNEGNARGYAVPKDDGGVNFFDFSGNRRGYLPPEE